ncbi:hypothetical protein JHD47_06460 [Sulfurimonas sp. SAG-AH-194-L11]|nr:hypothetical protein [Sulfurimonas sp. SAG-AH-194-L11]MDF1877455.1 hypothetical protein [Sulfurimonas sp. SAG-AH-194-L11]
MKIVFIYLLLLLNLYAQKSVIKTSFINQANYANKSMQEIKVILLEKVKVDAASEIFGDFIKSETDIENGKMIRNLIISEKNGLVHIKGTPKYANGKNFGDIQVTVEAYATDEDLKNMSIQKIKVTDYVYTNPNIALKDIKKAAEDAFLVYALSTKRASLKNNPNQISIARELSIALSITKSVFDPKNSAYTMSGTVDYIPFFLKNK